MRTHELISHTNVKIHSPVRENETCYPTKTLDNRIKPCHVPVTEEALTHQYTPT